MSNDDSNTITSEPVPVSHSEPRTSRSQNREDPVPKERLVRVIRKVVRSEIRFSGPLPHPELLARYNDAFPDCPERIVAMAEREASHRHDMERRDLDGSIRFASRGQIIGAIVMLAALIGGVYLLEHDKSASGFSLVLGDILLFGGAFAVDRYRQYRKETGDGKAKPDSKRTQELEAPPVSVSTDDSDSEPAAPVSV